MNITPEERKILAAVVAQAWMNPAYKQSLLFNPTSVMKAAGIEVPDDVTVRIVEDTSTVKNIVLDPHPLPPEQVVDELPPNPSFYQVYAYIYTKSITDPEFKASFLADPADTVKRLGFNLPEPFTIAVHQNTDKVRYFVLPTPPATSVNTQSLQNEVEMFATDPVNTDININANVNTQVNTQVNLNVDTNVNAALQVNGAAVASVVVAVAVLI